MRRTSVKSGARHKEATSVRPIVAGKDAREPDVTLAQQAYQRLRIDILDGAFDAGKPLRLEALKARYNLSFSPLREALNRLHSERLVVASALRGFRVAELSLDRMWDSINTRILIESEALTKAIERGNDDWEASIIAAFHAFSRCIKRIGAQPHAPKKEEGDELERRHREFHLSLISACGSTWLIEFSTQLYEQTERYRRPMINALSVKRDVVGEHQAIMKATLNRNAKQASHLLSEHYRKTGRLIELNFEKAA